MLRKFEFRVPAKVVEVIDGDTVKLHLDLGWNLSMKTNVRFHRVNAPERNTIEGQKVTLWLRTKLSPDQLVIVSSVHLDKYGRTEGKIFLIEKDGSLTDLVQLMLNLGLVSPMK